MPTFASLIEKSVSDFRVLLQLDIGQKNTQWVNIGAGIWSVAALNDYAWVDSTLLVEGFSAQEFGVIGSVYVDGGLLLSRMDNLLGVTNGANSFYYDADTRTLYVRLPNSDEPSLHTIFIGVVYGFSFDEFAPEGEIHLYEGRLISLPNISISRDPLFYGKLQYGGGVAVINNADGEFDTWAKDNNIFGNEARIYIGFDGLDIDDYQVVYTGRIGTVTVSESQLTVDIQDKRKTLTRNILYSENPKNAVTAIQEILVEYFGATYDSNYFDTTAWATAVADSMPIGVEMAEEDQGIAIIEQICATVPGLFFITAAGKYSFKIIDTSAAASATIYADDIMEDIQITYDPAEVISSCKVGYDRDFATTGNAYSFSLENTDYQSSVYAAYKTYRMETFYTLHRNLTRATTHAETMMLYYKDVHGRTELVLPLSYYSLAIGDIVNAELLRPNKTMVGTTKTEIISIAYNFNEPRMRVGLRFI